MAPVRSGRRVEEEPVARRYLVMPHAEQGMIVGLFGGSFNPPHAGHQLVADIALRRLRLQQLWWMVTPGNPLKSRSNLAPLSERIAASEAMVHDPRIKVTAFEASLPASFTAQTIERIRARNPAVRFIWIMGADNLMSFDRWQRWREIVGKVPIAVIDRPGATLSYLSSKMARTFDYARVDEEDAATLAFRRAPAWTFIHGPRSPLSSTALRAARAG
ncbi:nicotinate-nucleotide adenylyltransferase [Xaviernesmea oryzae]|uniref:nicotinate-nucleotide adenylyltransferase n=1 Tax=Xaviernesmea oryzae TaxID=464029 RepID=UPI00094FCACF